MPKCNHDTCLMEAAPGSAYCRHCIQLPAKKCNLCNTYNGSRTVDELEGRLQGEIAKHRKRGITMYFLTQPLWGLQTRFHRAMQYHHVRKAAKLTMQGIGEFPGVDLKLTPYGPKILRELTRSQEHIDAEKRLKKEEITDGN